MEYHKTADFVENRPNTRKSNDPLNIRVKLSDKNFRRISLISAAMHGRLSKESISAVVNDAIEGYYQSDKIKKLMMV